jgi:hypothetical protein
MGDSMGIKADGWDSRGALKYHYGIKDGATGKCYQGWNLGGWRPRGVREAARIGKSRFGRGEKKWRRESSVRKKR